MKSPKKTIFLYLKARKILKQFLQADCDEL